MAAVPKIGQVVGGDYKGVMVGSGSKSDKTTVTIAGVGNKPLNSALIFFTKPEEYRFDGTDIENYSIHSSTNLETTYTIKFKDGKSSLVKINNQYKDQIDSALYK